MTWDAQQPAGAGYGDYGQGERSPQQLARLAQEWRRVQRGFAYHPHVTVTPIQGDPPDVFQVDYRVNTLVVDDAGQLGYAAAASVRLWVPAGFPEQAPLMQPMSGLFHPNVSYEGIHPGVAWHVNDSLESLIHRVGDLLAWRIYDPSYVLNPAALEWMNTNAALLPLDQQANFAPAAGGEPLARVVRFGPQSVETMRQSMLSLHESLLRPDARDTAAVNDFAARTRVALNLFLELDVPDALRSAAAELDDTARELPVAVACYEFLRGRRDAVRAAHDAARAVADVRGPLEKELTRLAALVNPQDLEPQRDEAGVFDPMELLGRLPDLKVIQSFQVQLPRVLQDAERRAAALVARAEALSAGHPPEDRPHDDMLGPRLSKELDAVAHDAGLASTAAAAARAEFEPLLKRAREDAAALEGVARWREYLELVLQGRALEKRVIEWGGDGVQAYFVEQAAARHGPFQFEQRVDLGPASFVVRDLGGNELDVRDPEDESLVGQSKAAEATLHLPPRRPPGDDAPPPKAKPARHTGALATLRLTGRCDDLLVQFNFLRTQTTESLEALGKAETTSDTWCGRVCRALADPAIRGKLERRRAKTDYRWRMVMLDLADLSPLKERVAAYFLLARASEVLPRWVKGMAEGQAKVEESQKRLEEISRRCERDIETNQIIVPPKLAAAYTQAVQSLEEARASVERAARPVRSLTSQLKARLQDPKRVGRPALPTFRSLQPLAESVSALPLTDDDLGLMIVRLETLLKTPLGGPRPGLNAVFSAAAPPRPTTSPPPAAEVADEPPEDEPPIGALETAPVRPEAPAPGEAAAETPPAGPEATASDEMPGEEAAGDPFIVDDEEPDATDAAEDDVFWDPSHGEQEPPPATGKSP